MKLTLVTVAFCLLALTAVWHTLHNLKSDRIGLRFALVWILMWLGIALFSIFPDLLNFFAGLASMRRIFFVLFVAIFVLFALLFKLMSLQENQAHRLAAVIRNMALMEHRLEELIRVVEESGAKDAALEGGSKGSEDQK